MVRPDVFIMLSWLDGVYFVYFLQIGYKANFWIASRSRHMELEDRQVKHKQLSGLN